MYRGLSIWGLSWMTSVPTEPSDRGGDWEMPYGQV